MRGRSFGPLLYFRGLAGDRVLMTAIVVADDGAPLPAIEVDGQAMPHRRILACRGAAVHRYELSLPARADAGYSCDGEEIAVDCDYQGDLRLAFVSCNGQELGDLARQRDERNAMWARLCHLHRQAPRHVLLQGGDQIYADEVTRAHHLSERWPKEVPECLDADQREELIEALRADFVERYVSTFSQPEYAWLAARVPTLAIWDDHDICDGWGSLPESVLRSDVGRALFATAREAFLVFQTGEAPDSVPLHMPDSTRKTVTWSVDLPGVRIVAPDLRSERSKERIMGDVGWRTFEAALADPPSRLILVSSVPALGPRLSLVEWVIQWTPWVEEYGDDLRDQWQSRTHREEWRRFLRCLVDLQERGTDVTIVSGEIHLATRGTMTTGRGPIHQLVASGISHPAPRPGYARGLNLLARLGEAPLLGHKITLAPLPGRRSTYVAERNFLTIDRQCARWSANWELEEGGTTPPLAV